MKKQTSGHWKSAVWKVHHEFSYERIILSLNSPEGSYFCVSFQALLILWLSARSSSLGNMLLRSKKILQKLLSKPDGFDLASTWGLEKKGRNFLYFSDRVWEWKKWILWEYSPLYSAIKQQQQRQFLFLTPSTRAQADSVLMFLMMPCVTPASSPAALGAPLPLWRWTREAHWKADYQTLSGGKSISKPRRRLVQKVTER